MIAKVLLPSTCPVCRRPGRAPCAGCAAVLRRAPALAPPPGLDACWSLLRYEDEGRALVTALKYRGGRDALAWAATAMAGLLVPPGGAIVTWAPTSAARRRRRGFDQAELLARAIARRWESPCAGLLRRGKGAPQTGRSAAARRAGPAFSATRPVAPAIVLVDDVVTSGATLTMAARALRAAGAEHVVALTLARTPLKSVSASSDHE
jgi:predicted amidophosphoribosyltransferase